MSLALRHASTLLTQTLTHTALNPLLTATLLYLLTASPRRIRSHLTHRIANPVRYARIVTALKWVLALGLVRKANQTLNAVALNGGRWGAAKWVVEGEVCVVTGGCGGIGELVVRKLAGKGVRVAVVDVVALPEGMRGYANIKHYPCDLTSPQAVYAAAEKIRATLGPPSILINNAGILAAHTILSTPDDYLRKIFDVNVLSNWYTVKAFLPHMIARNKGHVVTVASTASYLGVAGVADYTASKAAVLAFHESLNQELALRYKTTGIVTTSIHPGWVRTPLVKPVEAELSRNGSVLLEPGAVADAVVRSVLSGRGGQVFLPESAGRVAALRGMPNWVQERVRKGVGRTILEVVE
ncbi:NAD(P)-binding protein [Dothidotthia symphoricarpi CBS 119687]|uniref:Short-chain dehydrogenase/reductase 3 n=1 Tax=Dothidotthia symphoricarpi CBS 119687 TaxID=1392245 RepID=A0A6A6ABC2_9PLEO|nr:NAD(P)-binding protein [Dothidotthia symphoricarpi CBS 119687]KAF2129120.1 NAD(P)-binding protein [Dothidotthia symphoricarpi CBS 119687]